MNVVWGSIMATIGCLFFVSAIYTLITKKDVFLYKYFVQKTSLFYKEENKYKANYFYVVVGLIILVLGILWACGVIWKVA